MQSRIDHFMYAVPSLDESMEWALDVFGVKPAYGGEHIGLGTRNALLSLGNTYLEIIAPDPAQAPLSGLGAQFAALSEGGLVTWAARGDLMEIAQALQHHDMATHGPSRTQRKTQEGELLVWDLLFPVTTPYQGRMPFFIDWLECAHPSDTNPSGGEFHTLTLTDPNAEALSDIFTAIGLPIDVQNGEPQMTLSIETRKGTVDLMTTKETNAISMR